MLCSLMRAVALARAHNFSPALQQGIELDAAACAGVLEVLWLSFEADLSGSHADAFSDCASANQPQRSCTRFCSPSRACRGSTRVREHFAKPAPA